MNLKFGFGHVKTGDFTMIEYCFRYVRGDEPASWWMDMKPEHIVALTPKGFEGKDPKEIAQKVADTLAKDTTSDLALEFQWRDTKKKELFTKDRQISSRGQKHDEGN